MKKIALLFILTTFNIFSQSINDYKYVVVPTKFDFLNEENKYNLNTSTKLLLEKYGFVVYMNNQDIPTDIANNRCKSLNAEIINDSGLLVTKLKLVLKDCKDKVVYETALGKSREKEYAVAYNQAFRDAAKSFETLNYKYNGNQTTTISQEVIIKPIETKATLEAAVQSSGPTKTLANGQFYAQPIENGFQLVNTEPKVIYKIYNTSVPDFFIASKGEQKGVFFKKGNSWFFEYYHFNKLYSENVGVKF